MSTAKAPDDKPSGGVTFPRWMAPIAGFFAFAVAIPLVHGVVPWSISLLARRYGWSEGHPTIWNQLGLMPVTIAIIGLIWIMVIGLAHTHQLPERVGLDWTPKIFLSGGPYAFTRNPMYVAELLLWFGWAHYYGSVTVFLGFALFGAVSNFLIVPNEERALEAQFGDDYLQYKRRVPRWLLSAGARK